MLCLLAVGRRELRTHEHHGHHRLGGLAPSAGAAGCAGLPAGGGGGLLPQPVVHDHHEQRPPQTGTGLPHSNPTVNVLLTRTQQGVIS